MCAWRRKCIQTFSRKWTRHIFLDIGTAEWEECLWDRLISPYTSYRANRNVYVKSIYHNYHYVHKNRGPNTVIYYTQKQEIYCIKWSKYLRTAMKCTVGTRSRFCLHHHSLPSMAADSKIWVTCKRVSRNGTKKLENMVTRLSMILLQLCMIERTRY